MTLARPSGVRSSITKIAVAGVLIGTPAAAVNFPAFAAPDLGGASNVLPAPLPADPPTNEPAPPPPAPVQSNSAYDYWYNWYNSVGSADAGGGGGGG